VHNKKNSWSNNDIIYHILIDRFSSSKSDKNWKKPIFYGGTLKGINDKLPYLKNLGVTTLWISPFYKTSAYHGYHITDYFSVDPHFGNESDLQTLIDRVHANEMKIITDFVPNHCSKKHPFFIDAQINKNSKYKKWFYFKKWPNSYLSFLSFPEIPKLNLENSDTYKHIIDAAKYWLTFNFDGFRLDHVIGPSHKFWKKFHKEIKGINPNFKLIGEAWMAGIKYRELRTINMKQKRLLWLLGNSSTKLLQSYINIFDGVLDFQGQQFLTKYILNNYDQPTITRLFQDHYNKFPNTYFLPLFLDNHDMNRFLFVINGNKKLLQKAAAMQFSLRQPVIIYYGTETGMTQEQSIWDTPSHGDIIAREPMNWNQIDEDMLLFYQQLCHKRLLIN